MRYDRGRNARCGALLAGAMFIGASCRHAPRQSVSPHAEAIDYGIAFVPRTDRVDLLISVEFRADGTGPTVVGLPHDGAYGTSRMHRFVTELIGERGTTIAPTADSGVRLLTPGPDGRVRFRYRMSFPPGAFGDATYAPSTDSRHVHVAGAQWMPRIGDPAVARHQHMVIRSPRGDWRAYTSVGDDARRVETIAAYNDLGRSVMGTARGNAYAFRAAGRAVEVFAPGGLDIPSAEIGEAVRQIVTRQREVFDSAMPSNSVRRAMAAPRIFRVIVLPREGNVAGVASGSAFTAFVRRRITREQLYVLLAHEILHTWMTDEIITVGSRPQGAEDFVRSRWFIEGVTDFAARAMLREARLLSDLQFSRLINRDIINLRDNSHREESFDEVMRAANGGGFDVAYTKLSYYRGSLMALNWAAQLRRGGATHTLLDLLQHVYSAAAVRTEPLTYAEFYGILSSQGLDALGDVDRHVTRGEVPQPMSDALGPAFVLRDTSVASFDPGFLLSRTRSTGIVEGVVPGGPADRVGVRNGMRYVRAENATRFGNSWEPDKPLALVVAEGEGEHRFEIEPRGTPMQLRLFVPQP